MSYQPITSPNLAGLKVDIERASTPVLAGLRVFVENPTNSVTATISTPTLAGVKTFVENVPTTQNISITAASTPTLAGLRVFQENNPTTITATISSPTLSGLKVLPENTAVPFVSTSVVGIVASGSGDNTILPAQGAGKQIYVYAWNLSFSGTVNAKFTDGVSSKLLSGLYYGVANAGGGNSVSPNFLTNKPQPDLFHTSANSRLILNLSGSTAVGGQISYFVI